MKQETKELVEFIKQQIDCVKTEAIKQNAQSAWWFCQYEKAINFLNSLSEIESHLCRGGYIQDKNGTPCCDGDKISFRINKCNPIYFNNHLLLNESILTGYLRWIDFKGGFSIVYTEEKKYTSKTIFLTLIDISEFEKVEK